LPTAAGRFHPEPAAKTVSIGQIGESGIIWRHNASHCNRRPGAVGASLPPIFTSARHEIILCSRRAIHELRVQTGSRVISIAPRVLTDPAQCTPVDWVFVTTKAYDAAGAAAWINPLCANGAPAAILQNGVEHRKGLPGTSRSDLVLSSSTALRAFGFPRRCGSEDRPPRFR